MPGRDRLVPSGDSSARSVKGWPCAPATSTAPAWPGVARSVASGSRLVRSSVATSPPTASDAWAGWGRCSRNTPAAAGAANASLPNGPTVPAASPSASAADRPVRRWKGCASPSVQARAGPP